MTTREITSSLSFQSLDTMAKENKGAFGEALAGIWLKDKIKEDVSLVTETQIPEDDPKIWFSHLGRHRCKYGKVTEEGVEEISWEPDYSFHVTLPDFDVRKEILLEVKTGKSELQRNQLAVMKLVAQEADSLVFYCEVKLHKERADVTYEEVSVADLETEITEAESVECYDCGSMILPDVARLVDRDGSPVYLCPEGDCDQ
ncbi:hypothetical protein [Haloferax larsenii]|nr:hypothetical protein [Haloferax larsenii]